MKFKQIGVVKSILGILVVIGIVVSAGYGPDTKDPFKDNLQTLKEVGRYELISIEEINKNNGVVNIEIRALDKKTNETKVLPIEMTQMDNKMWRITGYDYKTYSLPYDGFDRI